MAMILTINPGSSSIKYSLFQNGKKLGFWNIKKEDQNFISFTQLLVKDGFIKTFDDINVFAVRVVHGGKIFKETTLIHSENLKTLEELSELAPLHNPPAIEMIREIISFRHPERAERVEGSRSEVVGSNSEIESETGFFVPFHSTQNDGPLIYAVFDTAFHNTLPEVAKTYAIPKDFTEKYGIQRFGFHGIACESALYKIEKETGGIRENIIVCHLGGGCSITAIKNGQSIDTSMGFTPLEGLVMMTRSGDIDAGVVDYLSKKLGKPVSEIDLILNKESGMLGMTGSDNMLELVERYQEGDESVKLAVELFLYRVQKYIFSYFGVLQGLDCLVFSGGMGEGNSFIRESITKSLKVVGCDIDIEKNNQQVETVQKISSEKSKIDVFIVHVNEDEEMIRQIKKTSH